jgi:hypothetical protein
LTFDAAAAAQLTAGYSDSQLSAEYSDDYGFLGGYGAVMPAAERNCLARPCALNPNRGATSQQDALDAPQSSSIEQHICLF